MAPPAAEGFEILPDAETDVATLEQGGYDYYLDVSINGVSCDKIVAIHQEPDGSLSVLPEDLKSIEIPTLVLHGEDDQIVPIADSAPLSAKLLKKATLKTYPKFPHGMCTTHADTINADILAFVRG